MTNNTLFITAQELAKEVGVSKPHAYKFIRKMNEELEKKGFMFVPGKVSRRYYEEKFYGVTQTNSQEAV